MTEKIDTQGMSGEAVKGCTDNVYPKDANGNPKGLHCHNRVSVASIDVNVEHMAVEVSTDALTGSGEIIPTSDIETLAETFSQGCSNGEHVQISIGRLRLGVSSL